MTGANLLGLLDFIQDILSQSMVIGGRFALLKGAGQDINVTNFGQIVEDAMSGFVEGKKYPCSLMLPPIKTSPTNDKGWANYKLNIYFLCLNGRTGDGDIKNPDLQTGISTHTYQMDWNDMDTVAECFVKSFRDATRWANLPVREHGKDNDSIMLVSSIGNDKANGVCLSYDVQIWTGLNCNTLPDYPKGITVNVTNFSPHPLHKM